MSIGWYFRRIRWATPFGCWLVSLIPHVWRPHSGGYEIAWVGVRPWPTLHVYSAKTVCRIWPRNMREDPFWPFKPKWGNPI